MCDGDSAGKPNIVILNHITLVVLGGGVESVIKHAAWDGGGGMQKHVD